MAVDQYEVFALGIIQACHFVASPDSLINSCLFGGFRSKVSVRGTNAMIAWRFEEGTSERLNIRDRIFSDFILTLTKGIELIVRFKSNPALFKLVFAGDKLKHR